MLNGAARSGWRVMPPDYCIPSGPGRPDYLRYALRSIEAVGLPIGNVVIAGHLPDYIDPAMVAHLTYPVHPHSRHNIGQAVRAVAFVSATSDKIVWCDDDVIYLQRPPWPLPLVARPFTAQEFVGGLRFQTGDTAHNEYVDGCYRQYDLLSEWGVDISTELWGESHHPVPTTRTALRELLAKLPPGYPAGAFKALLLAGTKPEPAKDIKIMRRTSALPDGYAVSFSAESWAGRAGQQVRARYKRPSSYERS